MTLGPQFNEHRKLYHGTDAVIPKGGTLEPGANVGTMGKGAYATTSMDQAADAAHDKLIHGDTLSDKPHQMPLFSPIYEVEPKTPESDFKEWNERDVNRDQGAAWRRYVPSSTSPEHVVDPEGMTVKGVAGHVSWDKKRI